MAISTLTPEAVRTELVRYLVAKNIVCPRTGDVLDVDTCVVINGADGDPLTVVSPEGGRQIADDLAVQAAMLERGWTIDLNTLLR